MYRWRHNNSHVFIWNCIGRNEQYGFRLYKVTWRFRIHMNSGIFNGEYNQTLNSRPWFHVQVSWQKDSAEPWIVWKVTSWFTGHERRTRRRTMPLIPLSLAKRVICNRMFWIVGIVKVLINNVILIKIQYLSFTKMHMKISSAGMDVWVIASHKNVKSGIRLK